MPERKISHFQEKEPILENLFRLIRFSKIKKYIPKNLIVLDVGCGYKGSFLKMLAKEIKKGVGYDLRVSKKTIAQNITLKSGSLEKKLPFKSNSFDVIIASAVIEHLNHPNFLIKEAYRILKPNGVLLITTPSPKSERLLKLLAKCQLISRKEINDHKQYFKKEKLIKFLTKEGFNKENIEINSFEFGFNLFVKAKKAKD